VLAVGKKNRCKNATPSNGPQWRNRGETHRRKQTKGKKLAHKRPEKKRGGGGGGEGEGGVLQKWCLDQSLNGREPIKKHKREDWEVKDSKRK